MRRSRLLLFLMLFVAVPLPAQQVVRNTIVLAAGETVVYTSASQIATLATPAGTNTGAGEVIRYQFDQYDTNIAIRGTKPGEVKLLIEGTTQRITEVVNVVVLEPAVADRYRFAVSSIAGIEGLSPASVHVGGRQVAVVGTVYSVADLNRCIALEGQYVETGSKKKKAEPVPPVSCLVDLSPAAPAVFPQQGYVPHVNVRLTELIGDPNAAVVEARERQTPWAAEVRLAQVPVLTLSSANRADLVARVSDFSRRLERAIAEWKKQAAANRIYPATFQVRPAAGAYELGMTWKYEQGRFGEALIRLTPEELQGASMRSGGGAERLVQWWAALLQDAFRLYFMSLRPAHGAAPLNDLYQNAVKLAPGAFDRASAPVAAARAHFAMRAASGKDPFEELLVRPPAEFQPSAIAP
jgi:hypothetical protein